MSRSIRRTGFVAAVAVVGALSLAGCGAGQITQTADAVSAVNAAEATVGQIALRGVEFPYTGPISAPAVYSAGATAPVQMSIINSGSQDDRLVSASSPVASSVQVSGDTTIPAGRAVLVNGGAGGTVPSAEPAPTSAAAPTNGRAPSAAPPPSAAPSASGTQITLTGLEQDIRAGLTYPLTLTFQRAGSVTVQVPVQNPSTPRQDTTAAPE